MAVRVTRTGVVLAVGILIGTVVLFGLLQIVRDRGEQARREEAISIAEENLRSESEQDVAIEVVEEETAQEGTGSETTSDAAVAESSSLPQTGPEILSVVAYGAVTFAAVSYFQSRKKLLEQL